MKPTACSESHEHDLESLGSGTGGASETDDILEILYLKLCRPTGPGPKWDLGVLTQSGRVHIFSNRNTKYHNKRLPR